MDESLKQALAHVLWIGGAPDTGKTSIAQTIAERQQCQLYRYDRTDVPHHERLAKTIAEYRNFVHASLDERWVLPEPEHLAHRAERSFQDRFPLVIEDLLALPQTAKIIAEGFGLTPDLIAPLLSTKHQAIWLVPTRDFKWESMQRRNKPAFRDQTSNPERARQNLFQRDLLLAEAVKAQAEACGLTVYEVDGSLSIQEMTQLVERHFGLSSP